MPAIRAVVFDVGETLVDETSVWSDWADWLGVFRFTFLAALGGVIARGLDHREVFGLIRPGLDLDAERRARMAAGRRHHVTVDDHYSDAVSCLHALVTDGYPIGIATNQPQAVEPVLRSLGVPLPSWRRPNAVAPCHHGRPPVETPWSRPRAPIRA